MVVIARVTGAVVLWLVALAIADLQMPSGQTEREDVTVEAVVDVPPSGSAGTRDVTVTNERSRPVVLAASGAALGDATPGCPASLVTRAAPAEAVEVPPGATVVVPVHVRVDGAAPATCRTETWPVELAASATPVAAPAAPSDDGPGLLPYAVATAGVLAVVGVALLAAAAVDRRRRPLPVSHDGPGGPASGPPVATATGRGAPTSRGPDPPRRR